jgi:hypothetical protein
MASHGEELLISADSHVGRAGVSRSTAAAALILMQANPEWPASAALDAIAAIRPRAWPNLLILEFGDTLLGRNVEDPHLWENRLPAAFKDRAPVFPEREVGGLFQAHAGGFRSWSKPFPS